MWGIFEKEGIVHVCPISHDDETDHLLSENCPCGPAYDVQDYSGKTILIHEQIN